jgi:methionyl-tRNA formyltransferase
MCLVYLLEKSITFEYIIGVKEEENKENSIIGLAKKHNIPFHLTDNPNEDLTLNLLRGINPDLFVLGGYSKILKKDILAIPSKFAINLHGGELPKYRGSSPMNWALINGEKTYTISIIKVALGVDAGNILKEYTQRIESTETINDLHRKANEHFPRMLFELINEIEENRFNEKIQKIDEGSYYPLRFKDDGFVLFDQELAVDIHNKIRSLTDPYPNAFSFYEGRKIFFKSSELTKTPFYGEPGRIYQLLEDKFLVCCKDKALWITSFQIENSNIEIFKRYSSFTTLKGELYKALNNGK